MRTLVTGASGQLGRELCRRLGADAVAADRTRLDVTDSDAVRRMVLDSAPEAIVLAAAYTQVDQAEDELDECRAVNVDSIEHFVAACAGTSIRLVLISTDYVFGGDASRATPLDERTPVAPLGVYGRTKAAGEQVVRQHVNHLIVRTCGLYDADPTSVNFVNTMLRLATQRRKLRVVNDQRCTPSFVPHVARGLLELTRRELQGTFHVVNAGATTWYEFAREIFRHRGLDVTVEPIRSDEFACRAKRPGYSVLDTSKYLATGAWALPTWQEALSERLS